RRRRHQAAILPEPAHLAKPQFRAPVPSSESVQASGWSAGLLRRDRDGYGVGPDLDGLAGLVGGGPDRDHEARGGKYVAGDEDVGDLPVRRDRDITGEAPVAPDRDRLAGLVDGGPDWGHRGRGSIARAIVGDVGGLAVRRNGDAEGEAPHRDGLAGLVGGGPDRGHRV